MARIRSIKPEFFIDEDLQDLEIANPGAYCMLVFAGLWGHCSKNGVFEYKPRTLKLSILPFITFSMVDTLALLESAGFICRFFADEKEYGFVPGFERHQRISGKEAQYSPKLPVFTPDEQQGINGEAAGKQREIEREAQEKEKEKEKEKEINKQQGASEQKTGTESQLRKYVKEHRERLTGLFPGADIGMELEEMVAKYRSVSIGADPAVLVVRWLRNLKKPRASPVVEQKSKGVLREEAAIRAAQETMALLEEMRNGTRKTGGEAVAGNDSGTRDRTAFTAPPSALSAISCGVAGG